MPGHTSDLSLIANALDSLLSCLREMGIFAVPDGGCLCKGMTAAMPSSVMSTLEPMPASGWFCPDNAAFTHPTCKLKCYNLDNLISILDLVGTNC